MKNRFLYFLLFLSLLSTGATAQKLVSPSQSPAVKIHPMQLPIGNSAAENSVLDTVFGPAFDEDCALQVTSYLSNDWGFIAGTNEYIDLEKAQRINLGAGSFTLYEVWGFFASASSVGNGTLRAKVYAATATGDPGALLATSSDINVSDIATDTASIVPTAFLFPTNPTIAGPYVFVSIDIADLYDTQDTVGLWSTQDGCGDGGDAYERWEDQSWFAFNDASSWGLEANLLIGAVVDSDVSSTQSPLSMNGLQVLSASPNPATSDIRISYRLADASKVQIQISGADGKVVQTINKGQQSSGEFMETLRLGHLPNGVYSYSVVTDNARLTDKFVVQR